MDKIGDKRIRTIHCGERFTEVFMPCIVCGKGRWQVLRHGKTDRPICRSCSTKRNWQNKEVRENRIKGIKRSKLNEEYKRHMKEIFTGERNPFYGKKHSEASREKMGKPRVNINILPNREWGYYIGLLLGDGCISKTKKNHKLVVASTRPEIVDKYYECCNNLKLRCVYYVNAKGTRYVAEVVSKKLYLELKLCKKDDYKFVVPDIVFNNKDMICGFLQGFYDAEGGVYGDRSTIEAWSKHYSNLLQIKKLLDVLGIYSILFKEKKKQISARIAICVYQDKLRFRELVGFRIKRKQVRLDNIKEPLHKTHDIENYNTALELRSSGLSYGQVSKKIGVSRDTIYGWVNNKTPRRYEAITI